MASSERRPAAHTNQDAGIRESNFERHSTQSPMQRRLRGSGGRFGQLPADWIEIEAGFAFEFESASPLLPLRPREGVHLGAAWLFWPLRSALARTTRRAPSHTNRRSARKQQTNRSDDPSQRHFAHSRPNGARRLACRPALPMSGGQPNRRSYLVSARSKRPEFNALIIESKKIKCPRCRSALTTSSPSPMLIFLAATRELLAQVRALSRRGWIPLPLPRRAAKWIHLPFAVRRSPFYICHLPAIRPTGPRVTSQRAPRRTHRSRANTPICPAIIPVRPSSAKCEMRDARCLMRGIEPAFCVPPDESEREKACHRPLGSPSGPPRAIRRPMEARESEQTRPTRASPPT